MTQLYPSPRTRLRTPFLSALLLSAGLIAASRPAAASTTCFAAWSASATYTGGQTASLNGANYTANWWTQNQSPATNSGGSGSGQPWTANGACGSGGPPPPPPPPNNPPPPGATSHIFAPYVDMSLTVDENLVAMQQQAGFNAVTLAFLDSTNGWGGLGGTLPTDSLPNGNTVLNVVEALQKVGVQVILSFGGANGVEPAVNCTSASQLQALYQSVINRYNVKMLDFDIEGGAVSNQASITLRDQALVGLKNSNPGLVISYTLPVLPTGLIASGVIS